MTVLQIKPPQNFWHAGNLEARHASEDPRQVRYPVTELDIDLRDCNFIQPPAVLWCVVYALLANRQGATCRFLVPENFGTAIYMKSVGLFETLQEAGIEVDDKGVPPRPDSKIALPISRFQNATDVDALANETLSRLSELGLGSASVRPLVSEVFAEIAMNAVQHADSPIDAYGLIQYYESGNGNRFFCAVSDGGIGIRQSLERNPKLRHLVASDWTALDLASQERISGLSDETRGVGLSWISQEMLKPGGHLILHSGQGMLQIAEGTAGPGMRTILFPGTLAFASIPT